MQEQVEKLVEAIIEDYRQWTERSYKANDWRTGSVDEDVKEFADGITVQFGRKYIKIIKRLSAEQRSVWGFVVAGDDKKFRKGDILKAAGWKAPARNHARGNIFDGGYSIQWTGPHYM